MQSQSNLGYVTKTLTDLKIHLEKRIATELDWEEDKKYIIFLSIGNPSIRARVLKEVAPSYTRAFSNLEKKVMQLVRKKHMDPQWIKIDIVSEIQEIAFADLEEKIARTRKNYFHYGIAFDDDFHLAFLEQEINGNAMIKSDKHNKPALSEQNINHYLKTNLENYRPFIKKQYEGKLVYIFKTISAFKDKQDIAFYDLYNGELINGIRKISNMEKETKNLITKSTWFLMNQMQETGQFHYGYFSAFAKKINTYNILRHSSSLYAMAEGYEVVKDNKIIQAVEKGIDYLVREAVVYKENGENPIAFVVDRANTNEIKLGSNATAILAMTKYMEVTGSNKYLSVAQSLARGILQLKTPSGGFIHVLSYPSFEIKELYRIIYYEGEAIFSLLRLYALDKKEIWLEEVKDSFDYFILKDYWKHHDHWLSYAVNELTIYEPKDEYFSFGLLNCHHRLNFIYHRETTYPTFLELTMAAYKMIQTIKEHKKEYLLKYIDEKFLEKTIDKRAEYQRVGFFYPELAMYMKNPGLVLDGFFIRHHSFRVRIDDVEHYLSGYCQYYHHRLPSIRKNKPLLLQV